MKLKILEIKSSTRNTKPILSVYRTGVAQFNKEAYSELGLKGFEYFMAAEDDDRNIYLIPTNTKTIYTQKIRHTLSEGCTIGNAQWILNIGLKTSTKYLASKVIDEDDPKVFYIKLEEIK